MIDTPMNADSSPSARYHRQMLLPGVGEAGQRRLYGSSALLIGCGALGTVIAESLVRAGVGRLRIIDRDLVELTNLQRQTLFIEADADEATPKAIAAARRLGQINRDVAVEPIVADYTAANALSLAADCDVLLDGTDNFETRLLINDVAVKLGKPYVYGGAVGTGGMMYVVLPTAGGAHRATPCLRCVLDEAPAPGSAATCDTSGVLGPIAGIIANLQAAEAIKLLSGNTAAVTRELICVELWPLRFRTLDVCGAFEAGACSCCGERRFEYLDAQRGSRTTSLCGRNAVQISASPAAVDLDALAQRLAPHGAVRRNEHLLRAELKQADRDLALTIFPDGRALIHGTADTTLARAIYSRYVGI